MAQGTGILTNFTSGEITKRLKGRVDVNRYYNGVEKQENFISLPHGGAKSRGGFRFIQETKASAKKSRLIPFVFSESVAYAMEFGDLYFRVYKNQLPIGAVDVVTTYTEAQLQELRYVQSADVIFLTHPGVRPKEIRRTSDTTWTIQNFIFQDGPYLDVNTTPTTMSPSGTTGAITITASATVGINGGAGFLSTDVGRLIRLSNPASGTQWGYAEITGVTSTTLVNATVKKAFARAVPPAGNAALSWALGAWSDTTGWPHVATFFQQRMLFASTSGSIDGQPQTIWSSVSADFDNFSPSSASGVVVDSDAVTFVMASKKINIIRWMEEANRALSIGGSGREFSLNRGLSIEILTPTNVKASPETSWGSSDLTKTPSVAIGNTVLYLDRSDRKLRQFSYSVQDDGYRAEDLTLMSEQITGKGIVDIAYQQNDDSVVWAAREDGVLLGMTYEPEQQVIAWHRHLLGRSLAGAAIVESLCTIPGVDSRDELWAITKRTINGTTKRYVEVLQRGFNSTLDLQKDAFCVDCAITYSGVPTTTITGLSHIEGETVTILADGATHPTKVVSGGSITLDRLASTVHVGLAYTPQIDTLPLYVKDALGKKKRIHRVTLRFYDTLGGKVGHDANHLEEVLFRAGNDPMDAPPPIFEGIKQVTFPGDWGLDVKVTIIQDQPLPMTILCIEEDFNVGER